MADIFISYSRHLSFQMCSPHYSETCQKPTKKTKNGKEKEGKREKYPQVFRYRARREREVERGSKEEGVL